MTPPDFLDRVFQKSCADMSEIPPDAIHCVVTSPPYEMQRRYSDDPQDHGNHAGAEFIERLRPAMREVLRVLRPDGSAFFNFIHTQIGGFASPTLHKFPALLEESGFKIVQPLSWLKTNARPSADPRLLKPSVEMIYHVAKTKDYFADKDTVRVPSIWAGRDHRATKYNPLGGDRGNWFCPALDQISKMSLHDVLQVFLGDGVDVLPLRKSQEQSTIHPAKMPDELADWLIRYGSRPGDTVLDPWAGSGTSLCRAKVLGRHWVGYELSADYARLAEERIARVTFGEALGGEAVSATVAARKLSMRAKPVILAKKACRACGKPYEPKRRWQTSCSSKCRYTHWNRANTRYIGRKTDGKTTDVAGGGGGGAPSAEDALRVDVEKEDSPQKGSGPGAI